MASLHTYAWRNLSPTQTDTLASLCAQFMVQAGYPDASSFFTAVRAANPAILDWMAVPDQATVIIPFQSTT